jgi:hypothetical protein
VLVLEVQLPRTFSFCWTHPAGEVAVDGNLLVVRSDLTPSGEGTLLKMTETGFREMGWELAKLDEEYRSHSSGRDF